MIEQRFSGISQKEVAESRREYAKNIMTPPPGVPVWKKFMEKFKDPMIVILIVSGILSLGISFYGCYWSGHGADAFIEPIGIFIANARAYSTGRSALHLRGCSGFGVTALIIVVGQILIVSVGGRFFSVEPLKFTDWLLIIGGTSIVLWIGEVIRLLSNKSVEHD